MAELIDEPLATLRLLHDTLLVVLSDATTQLVVVHGRTIFTLAPEPGHADRILDLEHALATIQPAYTGTVHTGTLQQLLQELPQVYVRATVSHLTATTTAATGCPGLRGTAVFVFVWKKSASRRDASFSHLSSRRRH